eukprot:CAMPEP_0117759262 /NCGR_PEP_ID=MMETSP0947-20121206/15910_1 /TAXON_ID=44440 /ORGANISM="Chattonella subsalsa, Strain CCMP2191" /LENGTH=833 /DNA_ID=CAMNT_0005579689 /DNA_START=50 /DNA_END=2548 /DNA_ORIENTATION=+
MSEAKKEEKNNSSSPKEEPEASPEPPEVKCNKRSCSTDKQQKKPLAKVVKVYARLPPHCPYIGTFHYAPSAKNRSRQNFFKHLIIPEEDIERLHVWKTDAMIGAIVRGSAYYHAQHQAMEGFSTARRNQKRVRAATIIGMGSENRDSIMSLESLSSAASKSQRKPEILQAQAKNLAEGQKELKKDEGEEEQQANKKGGDGKNVSIVTPQPVPQIERREEHLDKHSLYISQSHLSEESSVLTSISEDEINELRKQGGITPVMFNSSQIQQHQSQQQNPNPARPSPPPNNPAGLRPRIASDSVKKSGSSRQRTGSGGCYSLVPQSVLEERTANTDGVRSRENSTGNLLSLGQLSRSPIRMIGGEEELAAGGNQMYQCFLTNDETHMILKRRMKERAVRQPKRQVLSPLKASATTPKRSYATSGTTLVLASPSPNSVAGESFFPDDEELLDLSHNEESSSPMKNPLRQRPLSAIAMPRGRARTIDVASLERADSEPLDMMSQGPSELGSPIEDPGERSPLDDEIEKGRNSGKARFNAATKFAQKMQRKESFSRRGTINLKGATPYVVKDATQLGQYTLQENQEFGEGSFAAVYLATHKDSKLKVAIKQIKKRYLFSDEEKASVWREIENHQRASSHRNITSLFEIFETPEYINMVLELADCGDLERMLQMRRTLSEVEAKRVIKQLLEGLAHIHSTDLVHLDLKPANILFAHDPEVRCDTCGSSVGEWKAKKPGGQPSHTSPSALLLKICDFGLSRKVPDVRYFKVTGDVNKIPFTALTGTEQFMAPEILLKEAYGKPADMWSLGVIMYKLLGGIMPFIPTRACFARKPAFPGFLW